MADYPKHLYMIVFPINALVASQLEPKEFAQHYTIGSARHFQGKVIFAEIDIAFRDPYFAIDDYLAQTVPHPDGTPKRTKFISTYRVLEHMSLDAIQSLHLVTPNGNALELRAAEYDKQNAGNLIRLYQSIAPASNFVASRLDQRAFGSYLTQSRSKGAPRICFTQIDFNIEEFMAENRNREIMTSPIPDSNPYQLLDCLTELDHDPNKMVKTITLSTVLHAVSYRLLRHGFWFFGAEGMKFFPMPDMHDLETKHYDWWKHVR